MKNIPQLRFAGFEGEWEECTMLDFGRSLGGSSIESEFSDSGDYYVISIGSYGMNNKYIDQGLRVSLNDKTKSKLLSKDDLTMVLNDKTSSGNIIGRVLLIESDYKYVFNQRTQKIKPNKDLFNSLFLYTFLNADKNRKKIQKLVQGNTQIYINWSTVENIKYITPKKMNKKKSETCLKRLTP